MDVKKELIKDIQLLYKDKNEYSERKRIIVTSLMKYYVEDLVGNNTIVMDKIISYIERCNNLMLLGLLESLSTLYVHDDIKLVVRN